MSAGALIILTPQLTRCNEIKKLYLYVHKYICSILVNLNSFEDSELNKNKNKKKKKKKLF